MGLDQTPVGRAERHELTAVELGLADPMLRVADLDSATGSQREEVAARIGGLQVHDRAIGVEDSLLWSVVIPKQRSSYQALYHF